MSSSALRKLLVFLMIATLVVGLAMTTGASAHTEWPFVKPQISAAVNGDLVIYTVWLKSQSNEEQEFIDLSVKVPQGTTLVHSHAGSYYSNAGKYDGTSVSWHLGSLKPEATDGPFVLVVKANPRNPDDQGTTLSASAWVKWQRGEASSETIALRNPLSPVLAYAVAPAGSHNAMVHAGYLDVTGNINDLRTQIANWDEGNDSGRRIGIEKIDRLDWIIPHVDWPNEMKASIAELGEAIELVEAALKAEDLNAAKQALTKVSSASHDLTHAFYDKWAASIKAQTGAGAVHAGYLDVSSNINDLRAQVTNWEQGSDSGRRIASEKVDRLEWSIPHVDWPSEMAPTMSKLYLALDQVKSGLKAENLEVTKESIAPVGTLSHDLTHAFYDKWAASLKAQAGDAMAHAGYLDVSSNISDLRTQITNWEQGNDSGRRIGIEKVDRLEWIVPHIAWPSEMEANIGKLSQALGSVGAALKAQDLNAAKEAVSKVGGISHDLTHDFYDKWVASMRAGRMIAAAESSPMEQAMPAATAPMAQMPAAPMMPGATMPAISADLASKGQQVYSGKGCAGCHGASGQGGAGPTLKHWHDADTIKSIVRGGEGMMPPYAAGQIDDDALTALIAFVQSLATER